jgi:cysteine synthase A
MALAMIQEAERRGDLRPGMAVVEYTGGSTGSSLAFVCAIKGYRFRVVSSDAFAVEKLRTMQVFGAELHIVPSDGGQVTPDLVPRMMDRAREIAASQPSYFTNQLHNVDVVKGYEALGVELVEQLGTAVHAFCGGVGTAGMITGVARVLRRLAPVPRIVALEPASSPALSKGVGGSHRIEGVGIGVVPPLFDKGLVNEARAVDEAAARRMAWRLAGEEGVFAGTSTGMNVVGALGLAQELGPGHTIVTVAVDSGLKYLTGDLYGQDHP